MSVRLATVLPNDDHPDIVQVPSHPHPLRSHRSSPIIPFPDFFEITQQQRLVQRVVPHQPPDYPRSRWSESTRDSAVDSIIERPIQSLPSSPHSSFSGTFPSPRTKTGLIGSPLLTTSSNSKDGFPIIPTRSPLKPTFTHADDNEIPHVSTIFNEIDWKTETQAVSTETLAGPCTTTTTTTITEIPSLHLVVLYLFVFIYGMNTTALAGLLHHITTDYHCSLTRALWAAIAFLLASAFPSSLLPTLPSTSIAKYLLLASIVLFTAASIISALASSYTTLLLGRILQGLTTTLTTTLLTRSVFDTHTTLNLTFWIGATGAPLIGAAFTIVGWRHLFWLSTGIGILCSIILLPATTPPPTTTAPPTSKRAGVWGPALVTVTLISIATAWSATFYSWKSWQVLLPLTPGFLLAIGVLGHVYQQGEVQHRPLAFLRSTTVLVQGLLFSAVLYLLPLLFTTSTLQMSLHVLPFLAATVLSAALTTFILPYLINRQLLTTIASLLTTLSLGLLVLLHTSSPAALSIPVLVLLGTGLGSLYSSLSPKVLSALHVLGLTLGLGLGTAVYIPTSSFTPVWVTLTGISGFITICQIGVAVWEGCYSFHHRGT